MNGGVVVLGVIQTHAYPHVSSRPGTNQRRSHHGSDRKPHAKSTCTRDVLVSSLIKVLEGIRKHTSYGLIDILIIKLLLLFTNYHPSQRPEKNKNTAGVVVTAQRVSMP